MNAPTERIFRLPFVRLLSVQPLAGFSICTFYLLPKFLATELHATPSQIGLVSAAYGLAGVLAVPLLAVLLDRFSPRVLIVAGCFVLMMTAVGFAWVDRVGVLVLSLRMAQGLAWAILFTAGMMLTIKLSPSNRLAQAIGYYSVATLAMNAVAPAAAEIISDRFGWTPVFVLASVMGFLGLLLGYGLPNERPSEKTAVRMSTLLVKPETLAMAGVVAIWGCAFGAMFIFYQPFALSLGIQKLRGFFVAYTLTAVLARVGTGGAIDRIGRQSISVVSLTLYALVVLAMQALGPGWLEWMGAAFGLAHGFFFPAYSALVVERARPEERGKLMALSNAAFNAGLAASSIVLGAVAERDGYPHAFFVAGMVTLTGVGLLVATAPPKRQPAVASVTRRGPVE
jgi:MFS family permease